ncbi:hypothetical protein L2E82_01695 [Cichorium intybus]|uniref:Uncharacterized protein n=1 Tax=Cichorium intybus TaxID=13427 RepID=A0ACB9GZP4_CICIN|nr:hypothetical protein L2E82_01695 [Cichorium intybus]
MTTTLIIKHLACVPSHSLHAPPMLIFASSFRLWTSFLVGGSGILCSPIHDYEFLHRYSPSSSQFSSLTVSIAIVLALIILLFLTARNNTRDGLPRDPTLKQIPVPMAPVYLIKRLTST